MQYLRSVLLIVLLFLSMLPCACWVIVAAPFGRAASYKGAMAWSRLSLWLARVICGLRHTVSGQENIPQKNCVVYLKHSSSWETIAELCVFPQQTWVLKRELYWIPFFGWGVALLRPIAIDRGARQSAVKQVIKKGSERIRQGLWVMIFPEGTRMPPGTTRRYGLSGALLALKADCPIVPVAHNAEDFWPRRSILKHPGEIRMVIGPAIETRGREPEEINKEAQTWIENTMREISTSYQNN